MPEESTPDQPGKNSREPDLARAQKRGQAQPSKTDQPWNWSLNHYITRLVDHLITTIECPRQTRAHNLPPKEDHSQRTRAPYTQHALIGYEPGIDQMNEPAATRHPVKDLLLTLAT